MAKATLVVLTNPRSAEQELQYNAWYDNVHLQDVLKVPGFSAAQRFRLSDAQMDPDGEPPAHRYLALYEVDADDVTATAQALLAVAFTDEMPISEALDHEGSSAFFYEPIGQRVAAQGSD